MEVLTIGTPSDYSAESGLNNDLFDITRDTRKDAYTFTINNTNYDSRNYGYWYVEDVQYNINFTTNNIRTADYYTPLKYELRAYYNQAGTASPGVETNASASSLILKNTSNASDFIYFDKDCTGNPSFSKNLSNDDVINSYVTTNRFNGVPNLYFFNNQTATIKLKYKVGGYSKRFLLDKDINVLEHSFSYYSSAKVNQIKWSQYTANAQHLHMTNLKEM